MPFPLATIPEAPPPLATVDDVTVGAWRVPTEAPESDGTLTWDATTLVGVHVSGGGLTGFGFTYAEAAAAHLIADRLAPLVLGGDAMAPQAAYHKMRVALRNSGQAGLGACAVSAVDCALWDLKARLLDLPMVHLLGPVRDRVKAYASGGFTSYAEGRLMDQLDGWLNAGFTAMKIKIGGQGILDLDRVQLTRDTIGNGADIFVDANGAYTPKLALGYAARLGDRGVTWFEEPVSSDDLPGLRMVRQGVPGAMQVAAGEYAWSPLDIRRLAEAQAVDVLQADVTRCGGVTGFLEIAALAEAFHLPLSTHTAPSLHATVACAAQPVIHAEYFHDHVRLEGMLLDGAVRAAGGFIAPDATAPGWGLSLKQADAQAFEV